MTPSFGIPSHPPLDPWDQPGAATSSPARRPPPAPSVVRDDWEDDDDDDDETNSTTAREHIDNPPSARQQSVSPILNDEENSEENRRIWEAANAKVAALMPTVLTSRTSSAVPPPPAAFQPTLRILKRPQSSTPSPKESSATSPTPGESLQEREARYAAARERIFRGPDNGQHDNTLDTDEGKRRDSTKSPSQTPSGSSVKIVRPPKAPEQQTQDKQGESVGFGQKRTKPPLSPSGSRS